MIWVYGYFGLVFLVCAWFVFIKPMFDFFAFFTHDTDLATAVIFGVGLAFLTVFFWWVLSKVRRS